MQALPLVRPQRLTPPAYNARQEVRCCALSRQRACIWSNLGEVNFDFRDTHQQQKRVLHSPRFVCLGSQDFAGAYALTRNITYVAALDLKISVNHGAC